MTTETLSVAGAFDKLTEQFRPEKAEGLTKTFRFVVTGEDAQERFISIDGGQVSVLEESDSVDVTLTISDQDFLSLVEGKLNPQMAFMVGKLKVQGDLGLATKLGSLFL